MLGQRFTQSSQPNMSHLWVWVTGLNEVHVCEQYDVNDSYVAKGSHKI